MDLKINNKVYIVSGSSGGIGKGIAKILLNEGANVLITGRKNPKLLNTFNEFKKEHAESLDFHQCDMRDQNDVKKLIKKVLNRWGKINGIVANAAAIKKVDNDLNYKHDDWIWFFENNFNISLNFINESIDQLIKSQGSIVAIGSIAGVEHIQGAPDPYSVSKSALSSYIKSLSKKLGSHKVRANLVSPGNIIFPGGNWENKLKVNPDNVNEMLAKKVPLQTLGSVDDIGYAVAFLLSDRAKFVTGSNLIIDGGQTVSF